MSTFGRRYRMCQQRSCWPSRYPDCVRAPPLLPTLHNTHDMLLGEAGDAFSRHAIYTDPSTTSLPLAPSGAHRLRAPSSCSSTMVAQEITGAAASLWVKRPSQGCLARIRPRLRRPYLRQASQAHLRRATQPHLRQAAQPDLRLTTHLHARTLIWQRTTPLNGMMLPKLMCCFHVRWTDTPWTDTP